MKIISIITIVLLFSSQGFTQIEYDFDEQILPTVDSSLINTNSFKGKTLYIDFWFTTCKPCIREIEPLNELQKFFTSDTNIAFISICIENNDRQNVWRKIITDHAIKGTHLFYARNRPQKINLLRKYNIMFPTYLIVDKNMRVLTTDAPRPSEKLRVTWALYNAKKGNNLIESDWAFKNKSQAFQEFCLQNKQ